MKICHITTVHPEKDTRIFYKECKSLAKAGFEVKLIVINGRSFSEDGVEVIGVPCKFSGRIQRFLKAPKAAYRKALQVDAAIYHFHDPEFLSYAKKLQRKGKKALNPIFQEKKSSVVFLSDRNKLFGVVMNISQYEALMRIKAEYESKNWEKATESSLSFWNDSSNDIYEKLL